MGYEERTETQKRAMVLKCHILMQEEGRKSNPKGPLWLGYEIKYILRTLCSNLEFKNVHSYRDAWVAPTLSI